MDFDLIGKWVKQYEKGYWYVLDVKEYFECVLKEDSSSVEIRKTGKYFVLMKKGFTSNWKPSVTSSFSDSYWCVPVSEDEEKRIQRFYEENPKMKKKFDEKPFSPPKMITNVWITCQEGEELTLPADWNYPVNMLEVAKWIKSNHLITNKMPAQYLLNLCGYPWEFDEQKGRLYVEAELVDLSTIQ